VVDAVDPLGGSYFVESLTDEIESRATDYIARIDDMGGAVEAIERGWMKSEIEDAAYRVVQGVEDGSRPIVGVNRFVADTEEPVELHALDPELEQRQVERLERVRSERDQGAVDAALKRLSEAAHGSDNLLPPMKDALGAYATLGEVSDTLRAVFGGYEPTSF
jgi:methylmalonyl-CoA mutase N-terminal domain/subunit